MKGVLILCGALILIILSPFVINSVHDAKVTSFEQSFAGVTTAASVYSANITLSQDLYADQVANVTDISSNTTGDLPTAASYTALTHLLAVSGLQENTERTLVVTHEIANPSLAELASVDALLLTAVLLYFISILGLIAGAIYSYFR